MTRWMRVNAVIPLCLLLLVASGCGGDGGSSTAVNTITANKNVIYKHGDMIKYAASGGYTHADGSKMLITGGWLRLEILDEGLTNPLNGNIPVMSLIEAQSYDGLSVDTAGKSAPVRVVNYLYRYFIQDPATGTIEYQGEKLIDGYDNSGAPIWRTYWFQTPVNYIQYQLPVAVGDTRQIDYLKTTADAANTHSGTLNTVVQAKEVVTVPLGSFEAYRMYYVDTSTDAASNGSKISDRMQWIYPDLGIVRFDFNSTTPGDTGTFTLAMQQTTIPYLAGNKTFAAADPAVLPLNQAGNTTRYERSGFYMGADGTVDELSGWFTMDVLSTTVVNPVMNKTLNTLLETHYTVDKQTDLAGNVTSTATQQAFKRYFYIGANNAVAFAGDTGAAGTAIAGQQIWFDAGFVPMPYPYYVDTLHPQTQTQTINVYAWMNNAAAFLYSFTPTMTVVKTMKVDTSLGTFNCYLMTYLDTNGKTVEQYSYPALGVVKFRYPAPAGKIGYMDVTVSATNVPYQ